MDEIIQTRQQLNDWLNYELRHYRVSFLNKVFTISESAILRKHIILLRSAEYHHNAHHKIMGTYYRVRLSRFQNKYMLHIPLNTCGRGLYLIHVGSRLINGDAKFGSDCALHINTSIVAGGTGEGVPTLGDNIVLGVGAIVLGDVHIANGVAVGANAVVNKSVDEKNITLAGVPAKKISNSGRMEWNKDNRLINDSDNK